MKHYYRRSNLLLVILRVALALALLPAPGAGYAQETEATSNSPFLSSAWLRVGPAAGKFSLQNYIEEKRPDLATSFSRTGRLPLGIQFEKLETRWGINSQVVLIVWELILDQTSRNITDNEIDEIFQLLDSFETQRAWGTVPTTIVAVDGQQVTINENINPASAAILAALARFTPANIAQYKIDNGEWASEFTDLFREQFGDPLASPDVIPRIATTGFRLPFSGKNLFNGGPHGGGQTSGCALIAASDGSGLDFNAPEVLSVAAGEVIAVQNSNLGASIGKSVAVRHQVDGGSIVSMYWHLESISNDIFKGRSISRGTYIGAQGTGWNNAFPRHLHVELRTFNSNHSYLSLSSSGTPVSWVGNSIDSYSIWSMIMSGRGLNYEGSAVKGTGKSVTFENTQFPCGDGKRRTVGASVNASYDKNVMDNFYDHTVFANVNPAFKPAYLQSSNAPSCRSTTDSPAALDCGQTNRSPNKPSLSTPDDWSVNRDGRAPTLCWNNNGDPDGDPVEFYAEVFESAKGANSGWTRNTCWRPGELDGNYFNYQWRVKAKDNRGAESGWSDTRRFTIEAPNKPPTISFDTANGNGDNRITTRDQNWSFRGAAGDPEGQFREVRFQCPDCDNRGSGDDRSTSTNWTITRNGMSGRNYVYFEAFDDRQSTRSAKTLELNIDLAPPTTDIQITGNAPYGWFTEPAQVKLTAQDGNTGQATAGVKEVHYRRDGGGEQVQSGATVNFTEGGDGEHTVRFYSIDNVGNVESERSRTYRIDRTPPTAITGLSESSGVANNTWQKAQNKPTFTWSPSTDPLPASGHASGLGGYQLNFSQNPNETAVHKDVAAGETLEWTPNTAGVATGTYYLRGRTWDRAGNKSAWQTLFTFRYDGTPPPNPGQATHLNGSKNDTWQKITASPNFTWTAPLDEGSGVKGYLLYWGDNENGESSNFVTTNSYASNTPLCAPGQACTGYLRLLSQDNVDWQAEKWSTTFVLRYDGAPPVADFTVNNGVTQTAQTLLQLNLRATDAGSGLREMRFSNDGQEWTPWEVYAESRVWEIPGISRQYWPVYVQVKDAVGWTSNVVSRTVYFDVNVDRPRSANFRLFDWADVAGAGSHTSQPTGYKGHSTVGQVLDSPRITSTNYLLRGGYEAGSRAIPLVVPGHDEFTFINGIFASGVVNTTMQSGQYQMVGVWGEPGLPNNSTELASAGYRHQPGFLAARPSPKETRTPTPTPTPGPTPTPTPTPACDFPRVSIDNGAVFTTGTGVTLSLCAPRATEMMVSNDGGFAGAVWETYNRSRAWTLTSHSNYVLPRFVYAAFKDAAGQIYATYLDDIILDPTPPEAKVRVGTDLPLDTALLAAARSGRESNPLFHAQAATYLWEVNGQPLAEPIPLLSASADGGVDLYLSARDAVGNVTRMQVSDTGSFGGGWESYSALKAYTPSGGDGLKTVYARFQDEAGNTSQPVTATFALDTLPPVGGIALSHPILGPDVVTTTVWLGAEDNLSGVAAMRLSSDPTFADAVWRPFASTLPWVYSQADRSAAALYVQFRDYAGNESEVYDAPLFTDDTPPLVYVEVEAGETLTRTVRVYSYDELTYPARMRITNDPLFLDGVVLQPYADSLTWSFDARRVVWVQVQDGVGNWSEPYPAYAEQAYFDIAGDCNNDGKSDAGDISALALEIFDQDGDTPAGVVNGSFAGNPLGCDANRDAVVDAGDISCTVLLIFNGPGACSAQGAGLNESPAGATGTPFLTIPLGIPAAPGQPVTVPVTYGGNGSSISTLVFSLDYDQSILGFDGADSNGDGIPDGVSVTAPAGFQASVTYDGDDADGELDVLIADVFPPLAALPDGALISVTLNVTPTLSLPVESPLPFAQEPRPSFGSTGGGSVAGSVQDGSVLVKGTEYPIYLPTIQR